MNQGGQLEQTPVAPIEQIQPNDQAAPDRAAPRSRRRRPGYPSLPADQARPARTTAAADPAFASFLSRWTGWDEERFLQMNRMPEQAFGLRHLVHLKEICSSILSILRKKNLEK